MDEALRERDLRPVRSPFAALLGLGAASSDPATLQRGFEQFLRPVAERAQGRVDENACREDFKNRVARLREPAAEGRKTRAAAGAAAAAASRRPSAPDAPALAFLWPWTILRPLCGADAPGSPVVSWLHEWMLAPIVSDHLSRAGWDPQSAASFPALFEAALHAEKLTGTGPTAARSRPARKTRKKPPARPSWREILAVPAAERFLRVHDFEGVRWFSKEALELLVPCLSLVQTGDGQLTLEAGPVLELAAKSGYRWDDFLALIEPDSL